MFLFSDEDVMKAYQNANSISDIIKNLGLPVHGRYYKHIHESLERLHLTSPKKWNDKRKLPRIMKSCPVCNELFETVKGSYHEKTTCSKACSNTHFRTGENAGNYKHGNTKSYKRASCLDRSQAKCAMCGYNKFIEVLHVHHKDRDRSNNHSSNLVLLCPTCHAEEHFLAKDGSWTPK